jgi:hypothetical protein
MTSIFTCSAMVKKLQLLEALIFRVYKAMICSFSFLKL